MVLLVVVLGSLSSYFGYSWKQTTDQLTKELSTHSEGVTIYKWQEVGGKAMPITEIRTVRDTQKIFIHDQSTTTIKSGCSFGAAYSTRGSFGAYLAPDILAFGPGSIQVLGFASKDEVIGGVAYRLNF